MYSRRARHSLKRRRTGVVSLATALVLIGLSVAAYATTRTNAPSPNATTTISPRPRTLAGVDGVQSPQIIAENLRPGTTAWRIPANDNPNVIQGFANTTYASSGQGVKFYVSSHSVRYRIVAYRMGWYQGLGARQIWSSPREVGRVQPMCPVAHSTNMVSCTNWKRSLTVTVTPQFVPGDYLFKLIAGPRAASYVPLTIWDPQSTATYVVMNRSFVEQGWNAYGGYSFYQGVGPCILDSNTYPPCNRARVVSFDRPYNTGFGASDFIANEYPLVQLMEREGLNVTYITDVTLSEHPQLLQSHRVLLSLDHDETWTYSERAAVARAVAGGMNVVYFGAAAMVRHVRLQPSPFGPDSEEVDYRNALEDPLNGVASPLQVTGNTWDSPPTNWSPIPQIGVQYSGYLTPGASAAMVIYAPSSWVFAGTGLRKGTTLPGVIASDFDHVISSTLTPSNLEVLAHSPIPINSATVSGSTWGGVSYSDMVYFTNPRSGAGVIDTGNNVWIGDLHACPASNRHCPSPVLVAITNNILRLFGRGPAGHFEPARSNLATLKPLGS